MKKIHVILIKNECIKFACNEGLKIITLNSEIFKAESDDAIIHVDLLHLFGQFQQGHSIQDTLLNEMNLVLEDGSYL